MLASIGASEISPACGGQSNRPIVPINTAQNLLAAYLSQKRDRQVTDHAGVAADRYPTVRVIDGVMGVIGKPPITRRLR